VQKKLKITGKILTSISSVSDTIEYCTRYT